MSAKTPLLAACLGLLCAGAFAATPMERLRGQISGISGQTLTIRTSDGREVPVDLTDKTRFAELTRSSLDHVSDGSYIGTATKSVGNMQVALEVVVFPPALRGTGEGHYPWDRITDTTQSGQATTASAMTNGTVAKAAPAGAATKTNSSMTNGTVSAAGSAQGARQITVTYKGGKQVILVPPTAPIVAVHPAKRDDVKSGQGVFVVASQQGQELVAQRVMVGENGLHPPM